ASARSHGVFRLADGQARASLAGRYLDGALPARSVVIAGEQSGAVRYYTGRSIVRWDLLAADVLDDVVEQLTAHGYAVWIALDAWEEESFRRKFPRAAVAALDWPPRVEAGIGVVTRARRVRDREPYMRGEHIVTDRLR
ncbi:MAG: hypothetical protein ACRD1H_10305, partial [Vicinamibacterales bacterium]